MSSKGKFWRRKDKKHFKRHPQKAEAAFKKALKSGRHDKVISETDEEYKRGEALTSLD